METDKVGKWFLYNTSTGQILGKSMCLESNLTPLEPSQGYLEIPDDMENAREYYVDITLDPPVVTARTALSLTYNSTADADGVDEIVITGIPVGTYVGANLPDGVVSTTVDDGTVEISCTMAGTGYIRFVPLLHLEETIEVTFV